MLTLLTDNLHLAGLTLIGVTIGELLYRLSLLLDTWSESLTVSRVLNMRHVPYYLLFACTGTLILVTTGTGEADIMVIRLMAITFAWCVIRICGIIDNSFDDLNIFRERNAELGPGLATNYWFGFLQTVLMAEEEGDSVESMLREYLDQHLLRDHHQVHDKVILLLPSNCNFESNSLESEGVYKCLPECEDCENSKCKHDIVFKYKGQKKSLAVYWIFKNKDSKEKLFFVFDFPNILRSSMGPGKGWGESQRPGGRQLNIRTFKDTLSRLAKKNFKQSYITFVKYDTNQQQRPLSDILRQSMEQNLLDIE